MMINQQVNTSTDYIESQSRISKLREMLKLNISAQNKLKKIKQEIESRKRQLQEICGSSFHEITVYDIFDSRKAINEVKRVPIILQEQLMIKKNLTKDYNFKNKMINEQKQIKKKKEILTRSRTRALDLRIEPNPQNIDFAAEGQLKNKSGMEIYKDWRKMHRPYQRKKDMIIDDDRLRQKRKMYGDNWEKIGYFFNGFSFEHLYSHYRKNLVHVVKGKWDLHQNLVLIVLVDCYGVGNWALISKKLKDKSQFQIRERFCNVLDPEIKENKWSSDDQKSLLVMAEKYKYKWSKIVKEVPRFANKTDNALRRKFRNIMIKKTKNEIQHTLKYKPDLAQSILKFKAKYFNRTKKIVKAEYNQYQ